MTLQPCPTHSKEQPPKGRRGHGLGKSTANGALVPESLAWPDWLPIYFPPKTKSCERKLLPPKFQVSFELVLPWNSIFYYLQDSGTDKDWGIDPRWGFLTLEPWHSAMRANVFSRLDFPFGPLSLPLLSDFTFSASFLGFPFCWHFCWISLFLPLFLDLLFAASFVGFPFNSLCKTHHQFNKPGSKYLTFSFVNSFDHFWSQHSVSCVNHQSDPVSYVMLSLLFTVNPKPRKRCGSSTKLTFTALVNGTCVAKKFQEYIPRFGCQHHTDGIFVSFFCCVLFNALSILCDQCQSQMQANCSKTK